jgi:hypothetical protein
MVENLTARTNLAHPRPCHIRRVTAGAAWRQVETIGDAYMCVANLIKDQASWTTRQCARE